MLAPLSLRGAAVGEHEAGAVDLQAGPAAVGLARLHGDDHAMLDAAMPMYDALYAWCAGDRSETHRWSEPAAVGVPA